MAESCYTTFDKVRENLERIKLGPLGNLTWNDPIAKHSFINYVLKGIGFAFYSQMLNLIQTFKSLTCNII